MPTYKIVRMFQDEHWMSYMVKRGLTLEEAQEWCRDPETASRTATSAKAKRLTEARGPWFDGHEEE